MFDESFEIGKILKESEDFLGCFEFIFDIVFIEGRHVVIETIDIGTLFYHCAGCVFG